jgi:hypothetical protein
MKFTEGTIYALHTGYCMQETRFYQVTGFTKSRVLPSQAKAPSSGDWNASMSKTNRVLS